MISGTTLPSVLSTLAHLSKLREPLSRNKVNKDILVKIIWFLDLLGNLQKYTFGRKIVALFNQMSYTELDNVARMKKLKWLAT
jgi:hypothetical protein